MPCYSLSLAPVTNAVSIEAKHRNCPTASTQPDGWSGISHRGDSLLHFCELCEQIREKAQIRIGCFLSPLLLWQLANGNTLRHVQIMPDLISILSEPSSLAALAALIAMEVVLGIDNLIFISLVTNKLPEDQRPKARLIGIGLALGLRLILLSLVFVIVQLTAPIFTAFGHGFSWRDLILIGGGLFLVWKATKEIHHNVDTDPNPDVFDNKATSMAFGAAIGQIIMLDLVFSLDSIITAVGMTDEIAIMVIAVLVAVTVMLVAAGPLARFLEHNPTVVMLALAFLFMIGGTLIADGFGFHVPREIVYGAMAFSAIVEALNIFARQARNRKQTAAVSDDSGSPA